MSANLPAVFNQQFFAPAVDGVAMVAAGYTVQAYLNGTTTPHNTFTTAAGNVPNANPLTLDDDGRATMFFDPTVAYTLVLIDTLSAPVETFNDVVAAAAATGVVTSVNSLTGAVSLDASGIPYTTSSGATWLTSITVEGALDQIADRANAPPAASVTVADTGDLFTATDVEGALAELAGTSPAISAATAGLFLTNDGTVRSWGVAGAGTSTQTANGTITFPGGLIMKWGVTSTFGTDSAANAVTFPTAFPNSCFSVQVNAGTDSGVGGGTQYAYGVFNITAAGFKINNDATASIFYYFAVGN